MTTTPIADELDNLRDLTARFRTSQPTSDFSLAVTGRRIAAAAERLMTALSIRAYRPEPGTNDRTEQVVITLHDVDLSIRGRTDGEGGGDLFVRVDPDKRDRLDRARHPLVVEIGHAGEHTYGSAAGVWTCVCGHEVPAEPEHDDEINDHVRQCDDVARAAARALSGPRLTTTTED